jgi:hypothetical protein
MPALQTNDYTISYDPIYAREDEAVQAAYFGTSELGDFIEFKDQAHAVVFSVRSAHVLSIRREGDKR